MSLIFAYEIAFKMTEKWYKSASLLQKNSVNFKDIDMQFFSNGKAGKKNFLSEKFYLGGGVYKN